MMQYAPIDTKETQSSVLHVVSLIAPC